MNTMQKV